MIRIDGLSSIKMTAAAGSKSPAEETRVPLYDRLGGMPAIRAVVDDLFSRVAKDDRVNRWFSWADDPGRATAYKAHMADFVGHATGGPSRYKGLDMTTAHRGLRITKTAFLSVVEDLTATLKSLQVPEAEKNDLLGLLAPLESQIVEGR